MFIFSNFAHLIVSFLVIKEQPLADSSMCWSRDRVVGFVQVSTSSEFDFDRGRLHQPHLRMRTKLARSRPVSLQLHNQQLIWLAGRWKCTCTFCTGTRATSERSNAELSPRFKTRRCCFTTTWRASTSHSATLSRKWRHAKAKPSKPSQFEWQVTQKPVSAACFFSHHFSSSSKWSVHRKIGMLLVESWVGIS